MWEVMFCHGLCFSWMEDPNLLIHHRKKCIKQGSMAYAMFYWSLHVTTSDITSYTMNDEKPLKNKNKFTYKNLNWIWFQTTYEGFNVFFFSSAVRISAFTHAIHIFSLTCKKYLRQLTQLPFFSVILWLTLALIRINLNFIYNLCS